MQRSRAVLIGGWILGVAVAVGAAPARADQGAATPNGDAGVCMAEPGVSLDQINKINELKARETQAQEPTASNGDVVQLNNRGYYYGEDGVPAVVRDLQVLDIEMRRARAAAQREGRL